jgi:hypothetical protein
LATADLESSTNVDAGYDRNRAKRTRWATRDVRALVFQSRRRRRSVLRFSRSSVCRTSSMDGSPDRLAALAGGLPLSSEVEYGSSALSMAVVKSESRRPGWLSWRARVMASR